MDTGADSRRARRNLARTAARFPSHAQLPRELATRLLDHLDGLRIAPNRILCLSGGPGLLTEALTRLFPRADIVHADPVPALLAQVATRSRLRQLLGARPPLRLGCDPESLPLRNGSIDLLVAPMVLPWASPARFFAEARRVLGQDGLLLFATAGPDTLREWRRALLQARPDWPEPLGHSVLRLPDMHDLADAASHAGLASPVVDMEYLTIHYPDLPSLLGDLRVAGAGNALLERPQGLMTPRALGRLKALLEAQRQPEGLPQTLEAIYGHAWNTRPLIDGAGRPVIPIRVADARPGGRPEPGRG